MFYKLSIRIPDNRADIQIAAVKITPERIPYEILQIYFASVFADASFIRCQRMQQG
ncbi:MAG: hypothetical protein PUC03_05435 [Clostridiales bacterium]|nr:hypothetical protein [Clostridiales bacterium]